MLINSQREVTSGQPIVVFDAKGVESRVSMHELSYVCDAGLQKQFHGAWENMITQWGQETDYRSATITNEPQSDGRTNVTLEIRWVHDRNDRYVYVTDGKTADAIEWTSSSAGNVIQAGIGFVRNGGIAAVLAGMCVVFISSRMKRPSDDYQKEQCSVGRSK
ncbi:MAG TPA: hypothetical protein VG711_02525 [Phycisphaerales bacterium]|nr:hypothetical protein [Phycisphaerales bacterium]